MTIEELNAISTPELVKAWMAWRDEVLAGRRTVYVLFSRIFERVEGVYATHELAAMRRALLSEESRQLGQWEILEEEVCGRVEVGT